MEATIQNHPRARGNYTVIPLAKVLSRGLIGGLIATLVMDLILMGILAAARLPVLTCFSIVGDTVTRLFSPRDILIVGSIPLGVAAHYTIGPVMGGLIAIILTRVHTLRIDSPKKVIVSAVLLTEILSQPMLALTPVILRMTAYDTWIWFGSSLVMHLIWGLILGIILSYGLRLPNDFNNLAFRFLANIRGWFSNHII